MLLTPIDHLASLDQDKMEVHNEHAVLVLFGTHLVNDRIIFGPLECVIVWATKRFELIENRVQLRQDPGSEMHSERSLNAIILPAIRSCSIYESRYLLSSSSGRQEAGLLGNRNLSGKTNGLGPGSFWWNRLWAQAAAAASSGN